jgi:hypothetical protein
MLQAQTPETVMAFDAGFGVDFREPVLANVDCAYWANGNAIGTADTFVFVDFHLTVPRLKVACSDGGKRHRLYTRNLIKAMFDNV